MTVQIDTTAENNGLRLVNQGAHPSAPSVNHTILYVVTGSNSGLYIKNDAGQQIGPFITGSASSPASSPNFLGLVTFTAPSAAGWSWDNQGSSTGTFGTGYNHWNFPKQSAVNNSLQYRTPANTHYSIEMALLHDLSGGFNGGGNPGDAGIQIGFRDSGGKLVTLAHQYSGGTWNIATSKWNTSTSYNSNYTSYTGLGLGDALPQLLFVRLDYDGTNIKFMKSIDGLVWYVFDSRTLTDFLAAGTPNVYVGAYVNGSNVAVTLVHWKETALP